MKDRAMVNAKLIQENTLLKRRIRELEKSESEGKRAEEALRESEEKYRVLFEGSTHGILAANIETKRFAYANPSICRMLGYSELELLQLRIGDIHPRDSLEQVMIEFGSLIQGDKTLTSALPCLRKDGAVFYADISVAEAIIRERRYIVGFFADVTERKRMENELIEARKDLEKKVRERTLELENINTKLATEIDERKTTERALRESEERYRIVADNTYDWEFWLSPQHDVIYTSPSCERITGYLPHEFQQDPDLFLQIIHPDDLPKFEEHYCAEYKRDFSSSRELEYRIIHKNGSVRWISHLCGPVFGNDGVYIGIRGNNRDITEQKRAEQNLRKSEEKYRDIFNNAIEGIYQSTPEERFLSVNPAFARMCGYASPEEMTANVTNIGQQLYVNPHEREKWKGLLATRGVVENFETQFNRKDGRKIWVSFSARAVKDGEGNILHYEGAMEDISERKRIEEELQNSEDKFNRAFHSSPVLTAISTIEDGRFLDVNETFLRTLLFSREEVINKTFLELGIFANPLQRQVIRKMAGKEGYVRNIDVQVVAKDGHIIDALFSVEPLTINNEQCWLAVLVDVTEQKKKEEENLRLERQLRQAQKMEAIGTLAGGIAHDFNNILGAISGFTELTLEHVPANSKAKKNLKRILASSQRAVDLVSQILAFSRQTEKELRPLRLSPIIKDVLKLVRPTTPTTIEIRQDIRAEPDLAMADATYIHQMILNLCMNANHAMQKKGGVLSVGLTNESIVLGDMNHPGLKPGPHLKLTVSDTGEGIEPGIIDKIFDPFFTTKKQGEGTGLGLAVVHGIVKSLGGEIKVDSRLGQGTSFQVWLPMLLDSLPENFSEREDTVIVRGSGRILLVDDEEALVEMAKDMLESLGYEITATKSSIDALEIFRANPDQFDLVITDQTMPAMTGMALAQEIMKIRPDTPIILCTGFSSTVDAEKARKVGIREFVFKPIIKKKIADSILHILKNSRS
jgi:PAS domain S-box-containing protein